jgi:lactate dehydrogenase-like 2-hydroxyacid dehydrogenase
MSEPDESTQKVIDQVEKLLRVAAKTSNEAEAAAFSNKANELLAAHNLTLAEVESAGSGAVSGRRLDEQVAGGMYKYQRRLWHHVAQLNFCMYFTMVARVKEGTKKFKRGRKLTHEHRIVGRQVNVVSTKNIAGYLHGVIERMCRERLQDRTEMIVKGNNQFYSRDAIAYREGIADRVIEKIRERRADILEKERIETEKAARAAARKGS